LILDNSFCSGYGILVETDVSRRSSKELFVTSTFCGLDFSKTTLAEAGALDLLDLD